MSNGFDATVRVRVPQGLKDRLERIARAKVKLSTELSREALVQFVEREEAKMATNGHEPEPVKEASAA